MSPETHRLPGSGEDNRFQIAKRLRTKIKYLPAFIVGSIVRKSFANVCINVTERKLVITIRSYCLHNQLGIWIWGFSSSTFRLSRNLLLINYQPWSLMTGLVLARRRLSANDRLCVELRQVKWIWPTRRSIRTCRARVDSTTHKTIACWVRMKIFAVFNSLLGSNENICCFVSAIVFVNPALFLFFFYYIYSLFNYF